MENVKIKAHNMQIVMQIYVGKKNEFLMCVCVCGWLAFFYEGHSEGLENFPTHCPFYFPFYIF